MVYFGNFLFGGHNNYYKIVCSSEDQLGTINFTKYTFSIIDTTLFLTPQVTNISVIFILLCTLFPISNLL